MLEFYGATAAELYRRFPVTESPLRDALIAATLCLSAAGSAGPAHFVHRCSLVSAAPRSAGLPRHQFLGASGRGP